MFFNRRRSLYQPISEDESRRLGIKEENENMVETLEELSKNPPNLVVGECLHTIKFLFEEANVIGTLSKQRKYIMATGFYQMLYFDTRLNRRILKPFSKKFPQVFRPYKGQDLTNKTLLVARTGGIGDLLFILPNLIYLKEKYPSCTINICCAPQYHSMVKNWEYIENVYSMPIDLVYFMRSHYHVIFEGVIERCKESEKINAYELFSKWMGLNLPKEKLIPKQSAIISENAEKFISEEDKKNFILMQMRASSPIRTPRPLIFQEIINKLTDSGIKIVLTDLNKYQNTIEYFISTLKNQDKVFNFAKYSDHISDTISLASMSKMVVAVDSSLTHIAGSLDIPLYGIFGSFPGELRLATYPKAKWINVEYPCAPCFKHQSRICSHSKDNHPFCFDNMDIDLVVNEIKEMYNDKNIYDS